MDSIARQREQRYVTRVAIAASIGRMLSDPRLNADVLIEELNLVLPHQWVSLSSDETRAAVLNDLRVLLAAVEGRDDDLLIEDIRDKIAAHEGRGA